VNELTHESDEDKVKEKINPKLGGSEIFAGA
jgi:hypothetical protein